MDRIQSLEIELRYLDGQSTRRIAADLKLGRTVVRSHLRQRGVKERTWGEAARRRWPLNERCFETITPESAYWIGFLIADGSIVGGRLQVGLGAVDEKHLNKLRKFLKAENHGIYKYIVPERMIRGKMVRASEAVEFKVRSNKICSDLARYGVVERKSMREYAVPELAANRDFWRGVVDGDGCLSKGKMFGLGVCGSKQLMEQFVVWACSISSLVKPHRAVETKSKGLFEVCYTRRQARLLSHGLYDGASVALDRKAEIARLV